MGLRIAGIALAGIITMSLTWRLINAEEGRNAPQTTNGQKGGQTADAMDRYARYAGTEPALKLSFEYPAGWPFHEERGKVDIYSEVRFAGPRNADDTYTAIFSVRGSPLKAARGKYQDAAEAVAHTKQHLLQDSRIVSEQLTVVAGTKATELIVASTMPAIHHKGIKAMAVPLMGRTIFLERGPYLYELAFSADAREYDRSLQAFQHVLDTLQLQ